MKKIIIAFLILITLLGMTISIVAAEGTPRREAMKVTDVYEPYLPDHWIVSPEDELYSHQKVSNAPECAIDGVISCYDDSYLRFDILLKNSITFDYKVFYGVCLSYENIKEYFTYYTDTKKFLYEKEKNGEIIENKDLTADDAGDTAGVTDSGESKNNDVYFIIKKAAHISGVKGSSYYIPGYFYSGYITNKNAEKTADETCDVELEFQY